LTELFFEIQCAICETGGTTLTSNSVTA